MGPCKNYFGSEKNMTFSDYLASADSFNCTILFETTCVGEIRVVIKLNMYIKLKLRHPVVQWKFMALDSCFLCFDNCRITIRAIERS